MGVYIKGINYAECNKCPLNLMAISETCSLNKKKCPLVEVAEPHGRLIDADILTGMISKTSAEPEYQHTREDWRIGLYLAEDLTYEMPTVLEAESEDEE